MKGGPLEGIRVLELSQIIAGPFCGQNLADMGADVVKIEPPGGEGMRILGQFTPGESKSFHALNRGKRSIVLDLKNPEAQAVVHRMITDFDVFIVNSRFGVTKRLNIDYDTLKKYRPDLVYLDNTGYGSSGPSAERSGSDIVAQAFSGLMAGDKKIDEIGAPSAISASPIGDYTAGLAGAMGIVSALFHRQKTGEGQLITSSLLQAALAIQGTSVSKLPMADKIMLDPMMKKVNAIRERGGSYAEQLAAKTHMMGASMRLYYGGYPVKDGAILLGALTPRNREQMRRALGIEDEPTGSPDFNPLDPTNDPIVETVFEKIQSIMREKTMDEWIAIFDKEGAPVGKVNMPEEMIHEAQVQEMGYMYEYEHLVTGPEVMPGPVVNMSVTPTGTENPAPPLGHHTNEILIEHGYDVQKISALRDSGAAH